MLNVIIQIILINFVKVASHIQHQNMAQWPVKLWEVMFLKIKNVISHVTQDMS